MWHLRRTGFVEPDSRDEAVDQANLVVQQPEPHQRSDDVGDQEWQQDQAADDRRFGEPVHQYRDPHSEDRLQHDIDQDILDGHQQRVPEQLVLEEFGEVVQADEVRCSEQVVLGQAEVEAAEERVQVEHQEADRRGQDEDQRHAQITTAGRLVGSPDSRHKIFSIDRLNRVDDAHGRTASSLGE